MTVFYPPRENKLKFQLNARNKINDKYHKKLL